VRLLLIESDPATSESLERVLGDRGHDAVVAETGLAGLRMALADRFDAVVLVLELPDIHGLDVLKMLRAVSDVAVVAAVDEDASEMVETSNAGADDYVVKPYSADQLEARLLVVSRRAEPSGVHVLTVGHLRIDKTSRAAYLRGDELGLTRKEFDLLTYLARKRGEVVSKRELAAQVWSDPYGGSDRTVDVHLSWLRRKLGESAAAPRYLRTVRGVGIKLVDPG
jgi:two-component system, OmpR family, KDP operon response regulator KdpE